MKIFLPDIVVTQNGVFQPPPLALECALAVVPACMLPYLAKDRPAAALLFFVLMLAMASPRFFQYRKYGRLGQPIAAHVGDTLTFQRPADTRNPVTISLLNLRGVIVYGYVNAQVIRFVYLDGSFVEAKVAWGARRLREAVMQFTRDHLPSTVAVVTEEPQSHFATVRGDGPYTTL
jgi:hypothetical protein